MYDFSHRKAVSGYRLQEVNHCPGCGGSHWLVGRLTAECAFCGSALPLVGGGAGIGALRRNPAPPLAA